jgi:hypothetical protein
VGHFSRNPACWHVGCSFQVLQDGVSYTVLPEGLLQSGAQGNGISVHVCRVDPPPSGTSGRAVLKIAEHAAAEVGHHSGTPRVAHRAGYIHQSP